MTTSVVLWQIAQPDQEPTVAQEIAAAKKGLTEEQLNAIRERVKASKPKLYDNKPPKKEEEVERWWERP